MQHHLAKQHYLQAEVQTATPQKLQLMLIEAAIKNIHRTKKAWESERFDTGFDSLSLAQDIVTEILSSLDKEGNPELAGKIASIYVFIFRCLTEGGMTHDPKKLDDALRVLSSERETWRQVCEKFGSSLSGSDSSTRLDLSTESSGKPEVLPKPTGISNAGTNTAGTNTAGISTATFSKPKGSPSKSGMSWEV